MGGEGRGGKRRGGEVKNWTPLVTQTQHAAASAPRFVARVADYRAYTIYAKAIFYRFSHNSVESLYVADGPDKKKHFLTVIRLTSG